MARTVAIGYQNYQELIDHDAYPIFLWRSISQCDIILKMKYQIQSK